MHCPDDSFACNKACIPWEYVCDGTNQCPDGEDELICGKLSFFLVFSFQRVIFILQLFYRFMC